MVASGFEMFVSSVIVSIVFILLCINIPHDISDDRDKKKLTKKKPSDKVDL